MRGQPVKIAVNGWFADQWTTGSGQYLAGLARAMPEVGGQHEYLLIAPGGRSPDRAPDGWTMVRVPVPRFAGENLSKVWFEQVSFPRACRNVGAGAALVPYWGGPWWQSCPTAVTVHDIIPLLLPLYRGGFLQRGYTRLVAVTARRAAAVLTDSDASRRDIVERLKIDPARVHAIHLAVDPAYRRVRDEERLAQARARYALPEGPFLLYLGGYDARKNVGRLLQAYARLRRAWPTAGSPDPAHAEMPALVLAGRLPAADTPFAPNPRRVTEQLGLQEYVHYAGWVEEADKPALYSLAIAALFPSEYEGFGLPVLEAQACGCPVLTSGTKLSRANPD